METVKVSKRTAKRKARPGSRARFFEACQNSRNERCGERETGEREPVTQPYEAAGLAHSQGFPSRKSLSRTVQGRSARVPCRHRICAAASRRASHQRQRHALP